MLAAALSCNLARGLTDAVMYLVGASTESHRRASLVRPLRETTDPQQAQRLIAAALPVRFSDATQPQALAALRKRLESVPVPSTRIRADQIPGAVGVFLLVVLAMSPIVLPFVFSDQPTVALRVSNLLGLATLYGSGHVLGRYAGGPRVEVRTGDVCHRHRAPRDHHRARRMNLAPAACCAACRPRRAAYP